MSDKIEVKQYDDFTDCDGKKCGLGKWVVSNSYICPHNNLEVRHPELIKQWHPNNKPMSSYLSGSGQKVWWICEFNDCGCHIWECKIVDRTRIKRRTECPFCSKKTKTCIHYNLEVLYPHLKTEWDPNNLNPMNEYNPNSRSKVSWICSNSNQCQCHRWEAVINQRTKKDNPTGCPFCNKGKICDHNNLEVLYPDLKIEWNSNNPKQMSEYSYGTHDIVSWVCQNDKCQLRVWKMSINDRTYRNSGCPHCSKSKGYSNAEINWINEIQEKENIIIQNALSENGQFKIPGVGKADGYCEKTNTVYEFHGDFWHGNPSIFDRNEINPVTKTTYGELYDKTIKREQKIRELGYNLIVKWETDFTIAEPRVDGC